LHFHASLSENNTLGFTKDWLYKLISCDTPETPLNNPRF